MLHLHTALELAGAHAQEGDAVAVLGVHIGLDLEHEAGELAFGGRDFAHGGVAQLRRRRPVDQRVQDFAHAEVVDGGAEEHRRQLAGQEFVQIPLIGRALDQLDLHAQLFHFQREQLVQARVVYALDHFHVGDQFFRARFEQDDLVVQQAVNAAESLAHADGPGDRRATDLQHALHLVQQLQAVAHLAVVLVHEGDDGRAAQPADVQQLDGLLLHALGGVDHHQGAVHRGQHAVGVFGEVLVARGVQQVDGVVAVLELHHRGRHRDAALLLDLHPVGGGELAAFLALDGAGHLNGAGEQQQLFGERGLTGVRVGDDGEGAAVGHFFGDAGEFGGHGIACIGIR